MILEETATGIGVARISPSQNVRAGGKGFWTIEYVVGEKGLQKGGGIRITIPHGFSTPQISYEDAPGLVQADSSRKNTKLRIILNEKLCHSAKGYPGVDWITYHGKNLVVRLIQGQLIKGDVIRISYGTSAFPNNVQYFAGEAEFTVAVDPDGSCRGPYTGFYRLQEQPTIRVEPGKATRLKVIAPSIIEKGEIFSLRLTAYDRFINRAVDYEGELTLESSSNIKNLPKEIHFSPEDEGSKLITGLSCSTVGTQFITATDPVNSQSFVSNPIKVQERKKYNLYWGDPHFHTRFSDGLATPSDAYNSARINGLDFAAVTDHDFAGTYLSDNEWEAIKGATARMTIPGEFIALLAYEFSDRSYGGDRNIYFLSNKAMLTRCMNKSGTETLSPNELRKELEKEGIEAITIPHHPVSKCCSTDRVWDFYDPKYEPVVEIYSCWGNSEQENCARPFILPSKYTENRTVQGALKKGLRYGFIAGSDGHGGSPGYTNWLRHQKVYMGGYTAVKCQKLDREDIYKAMRNRHCYATTGVRIILDFWVDDAEMGDQVMVGQQKWEHGKRVINIEVIGEKPITKVELIRNNKVFKEFEPHSQEGQLEVVDNDKLSDIAFSPTKFISAPFVFYYIRVHQVDGNMAWSSPVWLIRKAD